MATASAKRFNMSPPSKGELIKDLHILQPHAGYARENNMRSEAGMKAVFFKEHGDLSVLQYGDLPLPEPAAGWVRLKVKACGLNYLDVFSRRGMPGIKIELPGVTGGDCAGVIDKLG